jgi:hypothetical protein
MAGLYSVNFGRQVKAKNVVGADTPVQQVFIIADTCEEALCVARARYPEQKIIFARDYPATVNQEGGK